MPYSIYLKNEQEKRSIYSDNSVTTQYNNVTFYSPGEYASNHKPEDYMKGNYESVIRNATIAKILYLNKSIEQFGSGFKRINSLCKDAGIHFSYLKRSGLFREHWTRYGIKVISSASVPNKIRNGRC